MLNWASVVRDQRQVCSQASSDLYAYKVTYVLLSWSPDPITNSETTNLNFHQSFDQLEEYRLRNWLLDPSRKGKNINYHKIHLKKKQSPDKSYIEKLARKQIAIRTPIISLECSHASCMFVVCISWKRAASLIFVKLSCTNNKYLDFHGFFAKLVCL